MSIQVRELTHIFSQGLPDETVALDKVDFEIYDGEIAAIIGHTGSGKSTLVQHLNGLLRPTSGSIIVGGIDITKKGVAMQEIRKRVGLVFQYPEYQLFEETVYKDVAFGPKNLGLSEEEIEKRVRESLELVGMDYEEVRDRSPFELSGGQKRRVAIAGILAMKPQVLILDEPTAGLDPGSHKDILDMIKRVHAADMRSIIIFVTHNMADVVEMSDKVLVMDRGRVLMTGTPEEVFAQRGSLSRIGLDVPPATDIMYRLKACGIPVTTHVFDIESAEEEIARYLLSPKGPLEKEIDVIDEIATEPYEDIEPDGGVASEDEPADEAAEGEAEV